MTTHAYWFALTRRVFYTVLILTLLLSQAAPASPVLAASPNLTVTPLSWNVIGLDSNNVLVGPNDFPIGARVCNTGTADATNVNAKFVWDTTDAYIYLRPESLNDIALSTLAAGSCANAYFEVMVARNPAAYDHSARYHIEITSTEITTAVKTPTPRELYVEHLVSQNRNSINDIQWRLSGSGAYQSVASGGSFTLMVGSTYDIKLVAATATQGYNQLEDFITLSNTYFRVNAVQSTYSATTLYDNTVSGALYDKLYADSCGWDNNPLSPTYRSCIISDNKSGGSITTNFNVTILSGGGKNLSLNSMVYDFSGSSFHYNADYSTSARLVNVITPISLTKSFSPSTITPGSTTKLQFTLSNASTASATSVSFIDNLPLSSGGAQMAVDTANPGITYSAGCLGGSLLNVSAAPSGALNAGLTFTGGVTAAVGATPGDCTISVNVKVPAAPTADTYLNTTGPVVLNSVPTDVSASASLTVSQTSTGTGLACTPAPLVTWTFPTGFSTSAPAASTNSVSAQAAAGAGLNPISSADRASTTGSQSWGSNGYFDDTVKTRTAPDLSMNDYFEFSLDTSSLTSVTLSFYLKGTNNGPAAWAIYYGAPTTDPTTLTAGPKGTVTTSWVSATPTPSTGSLTFNNTNPGWNKTGRTVFRIYGYNANQSNAGADMYLDDVTFSGCSTFQPSLTKAFSPNPVAESVESTLTFTLNNTNTSALTEAAFSDVLPAGLTISSAPAAGDNGCGGTLTAPVGGSTITLSGTGPGATIPAGGSCQIKVKVKSAAKGIYNNISGRLNTKELGTNTTPTGIAQSALTVVAAPGFTKTFSPNPIYAGQTATLTFTLTNPNSIDLTGATFTDPLPTGLTVAAAPAAVTTCASAAFSPVSGASSLTFTGTLPANSTCTAKVDVTASATGDYANPKTPYTLTVPSVSGLTVAGPADTLAVIARHPGLTILKQVALSAEGPWSSYLNMAAGSAVYYRIRVENTGDVDLSGLSVTDANVDLSACKWPLTLPVASATQDPTATCVLGPISTSITSGSFENTASASASYNGTPVSATSKATYAISDLLITKDAAPASFAAAGDVLTYTYVVKNNSTSAVLAGPVVVTDNLTSVTCPALSSVGNGDANLDPGESVTCSASYTVTAPNASAGVVTNSAYAAAGGITSNVARKSVYINKPDLTLSKTNDTGGFGTKGTPFHWVLKVNNLGPAAATFQAGETILSDALPAGPAYALTSAAPSSQTGITGAINCQINLGTLACTASGGPVSLAAATGSFSVSLGVTPNAGGSLTNTATVDPLDRIDEANDGNNTGSDTLSIDGNVYAIALSKSASPTTYAAKGTAIAYTYTITNQGTTALSGPFTVSDDKIASVTCPAAPAGGLAPLASLACSASYAIQQADLDAGSLTNNATASTTVSGQVITSNQATVTINALQSPALSFTKTPAKQYTPPASVGSTIQYTLVASNAGNVTLNSVSIVDAKLGSLICAKNGTATPQPVTLAPSDALTCTGTYALTQADIEAGKVDNSATVSSKRLDGSAGPASQQNVSTPIEQNPLIQVVKSSTITEINAVGQVVPYTFKVSSAGNVSLSMITVSDLKCDALPQYIGGDDNDGILQTGETWTYTCSHTVTLADFNASGKLTNTVTVGSAESPQATDTLQINVVLNPQISVSISSTTAQITAVGQSVPYIFDVSNAGNLTLTAVQVSDPVCDAAPVYLSGDANSDGKLQVGEIWKYTCSHTVTQPNLDAGGNFNSAVTADSFESGPAAADMDIPVIQTPGISLKKTGTAHLSQPAKLGDSIDYSLVATNTGNITLNTVAIADPLLALSCTKNGMAAAQPAALAPGDNLTCSGTYTLAQADINAGQVTNTAAVTSKKPDGSDGPTSSDSLTTGMLISLSKVGTLNAAGDTIDYTLTATNNSAAPLTHVVMSDPKLGTLNCTPNTSPLTLVPGDSLTCTGSYAVKLADLDAGQVTNTATVTSDTAGNTQTLVTNLPQAPALTLTKLATPHFSAPAVVGDTIDYTLTAQNTGNITLKSVSIADPKLGALTCAQPVDLIPGASLTCSGTYSLTQADIDAAKVSNSATATSQKPDGSAGPTAPAALDTLVPQNALISVIKSSTTTEINKAGQSVPYTFTVTNPGNVTLTSVTVSDPNCDASPQLSSGDTNGDGKLQVTETWLYTCSHAVTQPEMNTGGSLSGQVTASSAESAPATDTLAIPITQIPLISVDKQSTTTGINAAGQVVSFTFSVTNPGNVTLTGVTVSDPNCGADPQFSSGDTNGDGKLQQTETWVYTCSHTITQAEMDAGGTLAGQVTATSTESAPATDTLAIPYAQAPVIQVVKQSTTTEITAANQMVPYTFTISNPGNITLTGITLTDPNCDADPQLSSGDTNGDGKLQLTETWVYTCSHTVTQAEMNTGGSLSGLVTADSLESLPATHTLAIPITQSPALTLSKAATTHFSLPAAVGDAIDYTLVAKNTGNITLNTVDIQDNKLGILTCSPTSPAALLPGASLTCTGTYHLTQADINAAKVDNSAQVTSKRPNGTSGPTATSAVSTPMTSNTINPRLTLVQTVDKTSFSQLGEVLRFTLTATNTGNVTLTSVSIDPNALDNWLCTPAQPTTLNPGEALVCSGTHTVTTADLQSGVYDNPGNVTGTPPNGAPLTQTAPGNVVNPTQTHRLYLPIIQKPALTENWSLGLGYEDLPLLSNNNDYDYNDWMVEVKGSTVYSSKTAGIAQEVTFEFIPRARGAVLNHTFGINIPANAFASAGTAYLSVFDANHNLISTQAIPFAANSAASYVIFEKTSDAFPGNLTNTKEGSITQPSQRFATLRFVFEQPISLTVDLSSPHGGSLFFDPYLKVSNTQDEVHRGDIRLLATPYLIHWPEEGVRIDRVYPGVGYTPGMPPTFQFPDQWWTTYNHCTYDGVTCGTP